MCARNVNAEMPDRVRCCGVFQVSPPYDVSGNTALTAANLLFEMLCVFPGVKYKPLPI